MDESNSHEFAVDPTDREEYLDAVFEQHPDLASATAATGVVLNAPTETLGSELFHIYTPKGAAGEERMVSLVYESGLSASCLDVGTEDDAAAMVADQFAEATEGVVFPADVNGHAGVAWTTCSVPLEMDDEGYVVPGTGLVMTASQVMWADGTKVCWVTHPTLPHEELLRVARSMG